MQVDRINENTIRVRINKAELEKRGLHVLDLLGDKSKIQQFFYSILDEVDTDHTFSQEAPVTFQVMPNNGGLELLISKLTANDLGMHEQPASKQIAPFSDLPAAEAYRDSRRTQIKDETKMRQGYCFDDINQVVAVADNLRVQDLASSLYYWKGHFYLELAFLGADFSELLPQDAWTVANEYGIQTDNKTMKSVKEIGKCLLMRDALGSLRKYFKLQQRA